MTPTDHLAPEDTLPKTESVTNQEFADSLGIHFSMASKLRNGHRAPSLDLLIKIQKVYGLPAEEVLAAAEGGAEKFGDYLRRTIFASES